LRRSSLASMPGEVSAMIKLRCEISILNVHAPRWFRNATALDS
jgi:hypothetical protein